MVETILAQIGLPLLVNFIKGALQKIDNPIATSAAQALETVDSALKKRADFVRRYCASQSAYRGNGAA